MLFFNDFLFKKNCVDSSLLISSQRVYENYLNNFFLIFFIFIRNNKYSGNGGIIYFSNFLSNISIINSFFYLCSVTGSGGAIYCDGSIEGSKFIGKNNCFFNCQSDSGYSIAYISIHKNGDILFNYSTCSYSNGQSTLSIRYANFKFQNLNTSSNNGYLDSSIQIHSCSSSINTFFTCFNNSAYGICISINNCNSNIIYSNIVSNKINIHSSIWHAGVGTSIYSNSIFQNNTGILFIPNQGSILVTNSTIFHSGSISTVSISLNIIQYGLTNTFLISHVSLESCKTIKFNYNIISCPIINIKNNKFFQFIQIFIIHSLL